MASLSATLSNLANIIAASQSSLHRSRQDIRACLEYCHKPEEIQDWHRDKLSRVCSRPDCDDCGDLEVLCKRVGAHLFHAMEKAAMLQNWASGQDEFLSQPQHPRQLLNEALKNIYLALKEFRVVASTNMLQEAEKMEVVLIYLKMVYELKVILVVIAFRPEDAGAFFSYWTECLDATGLEGFRFDETKAIEKTYIRDRTLRGVLSAPNATPDSFLPSNPTYPVVFRNMGQYGAPVLQNALFLEFLQCGEEMEDDN